MSDPLYTVALVTDTLRAPASWMAMEDGSVEMTFDPPLTPAERSTLADLRRMAHFGVTLTLAEWQAIKEDAAGLKQYLGVASPTAAQTALATKAIIRVLATIIRD
ncbi:MAG TPA: hypothetical protein VMW94_04030 [Actinomycetes bacterium]|nr:hypothetical protein [Actinomycetes bacterium]